MALPFAQLYAFPPDDASATNRDAQLVFQDLFTQLNANVGATVASGTANRLAYYTSSTAIGALAAITASRALASDSNGLPVAASTTTTELNGLNGLTASRAIATTAGGILTASATTATELAGLNGLTASRAIVTTAGGILTAATTTATEIGFVNGVTSAIQTQLNGKANTALSNLASVAINTSLISDSNGVDDLGSSGLRWATGYFGGNVSVSGDQGGSNNNVTCSNTSNTANSLAFFSSVVAGTSAGDPYFHAQVSGATDYSWGIDNSDSDAWVLSANATLGTNNRIRVDSSNITLSYGATTGSNIDTSGNVTQPNQPSFLVTDGNGATDVTGDGTTYTELWPTEVYDQGGDFASNTFTAPVAGRYLLTAQVRLLNILSTHTVRILSIITSNRSYNNTSEYTLAEARRPLSVSVIADMDANDTATVEIRVDGSTKTVDVVALATANCFSGSLIN